MRCIGWSKGGPYAFLFVSIVTAWVLTGTKAQFRSQENRQRYEEPYNRPSTTKPRFRSKLDDLKYSDNVRFRSGYEYRLNQRGGNVDARERERLRINYNEQNPDYAEFELRNTIFDRWRPDLQGEKRPGETPGLNLPLAEDVFVSTDTGKLQGFYVYLYDMPTRRQEDRPATKPLELQRHLLNVTVFLGIPYAQPPVREGRFKPPRRVRNWHTTWQAIDYSPACPQNLKYVGYTKGIPSGIDEDCLYLNVFTPSLSVNARERYPVMFYIHGGDFDHGSGSQFPGHMLAAWGKVVVVTINYRLGALGFLSTGDYHSPGNYGLMDMSMALEWVHNNIRFFNGDRNRITVFGPGAGGAAAGLLAVLPKTRDWVSQVIGESGSPLAEWAAVDDPYRVQNTSRVFGLAMGCNVEDSYQILHCLVNRDYEELATAPVIPDVGTFAWSPVVDKNFTVAEDNWYEDWDERDWHALPDTPLHLYQQNQHHPALRYLTGFNRDEAANMAYEDVRLSKNNYEVTEEFFNERVKDWVKHYNYTLNPDGAYDAIKWMYTFWPDPLNTTHIRDEYINMLSDALYKSPVDQLVKVLTNSTLKKPVPTYYYMLNTTVEALKLPHWREIPNNLEFYFISGGPFMDPDFYPEDFRVARLQWTEGDRNMSQFMMKAFANFAQWGNPTQEQVEPIKVNWEPTLEGSFKYLSINTTFNTSLHYNYRQLQTTFWYEYMPRVVREFVPTPPPPRNPWVDMKEPVTATMYGLLALLVVLIVILLGCSGLWKSAKRQRNKALDDLSCYSTDNLSIYKDADDHDVRRYLEKFNGMQSAPSHTGTINTIISADQTQHMSRPITPSSHHTHNGKPNMSLSDPDNTYSSIKKPVQVQESFDYEPYKMKNHLNQKAFSNNDQRELIPLDTSSVASMPLEKPREQVRPLSQEPVRYMTREPVQEPSHIEPAKAPPQPMRRTFPQQPHNSTPEAEPNPNLNPTYSQPIGVPQPQTQYHEDPKNLQQPAHTYGNYHVPHTTTMVPSSSVGIPTDLPRTPATNRAGTPSAVTFEISMKPAKSVGTISSASGLILNTDL